MTKIKTITQGKYLQALGLFTIANQNYLRGASFTKELAAILGCDDEWAGRLGDEVLEDRPNFDEALQAEGFAVPAIKRKLITKQRKK